MDFQLHKDIRDLFHTFLASMSENTGNQGRTSTNDGQRTIIPSTPEPIHPLRSIPIAPQPSPSAFERQNTRSDTFLGGYQSPLITDRDVGRLLFQILSRASEPNQIDEIYLIGKGQPHDRSVENRPQNLKTAPGTLLAHYTTEYDATDLDSELIAGMFTMIQSFIHDCFGLGESDELTLIQFGSRKIMVEHSALFFIAVVFKGTTPSALRARLCALLDQIETTNFESGGEWTPTQVALAIRQSAMQLEAQ